MVWREIIGQMFAIWNQHKIKHISFLFLNALYFFFSSGDRPVSHFLNLYKVQSVIFGP